MGILSTPPVADRGVLLDEWLETRAEIARLEARSADLLASRSEVFWIEVGEAPRQRDAIRRSMIAEYSAAGHLPSTAVETAFADADALTGQFPALHAALRAGTITVAHVRAVIAAALPVRNAVHNGQLPESALAVYATAALTVAEEDTPTRTRVHAKQIAAALCGLTLPEQHAHAATERCITIRSLDDGMAMLTAVIPEIYAVAIKDRLTQLAHHIAHAATDTNTDGDYMPAATAAARRADLEDWPYLEDLDQDDPRQDSYQAAVLAGSSTYVTDPTHPDTPLEFVATDGRTHRQIEADTFIDLLLASSPSDTLGTGMERITATVHVTIAATTLTGNDDHIAELDGHGPLHPDHARHLAADTTGWNRLFLDPDGMVTHVDRYTPNAEIKRYLRARDQRCRFPGCHTPVHRCQIDHNHDYAKGGKTEISNLSNFCTAHHPLKHPDLDPIARWNAHQTPDGTIHWTSPLGRTYTDQTPRRVMFI